MNKDTRMIRLAITVSLGMLFAGCAVNSIAIAMGLQTSWVLIYTTALISALLVGLCSWSGVIAIVSGGLLVFTAGAYVVMHLDGLNAIQSLFASWQGAEIDAAQLALGGRMLMIIAAYVFGAIFAMLMCRREFVSLGIVVLFALLVGSHAISDSVSLISAAPGLIAAVAAFALAGGVQRDSTAARVMIPSVLVVGIALLLVPSGRVTWQPLEAAAERVRDVFEQYFNFSRERIAFSINEKGYDHAGKVNDTVVAMLGGPAQPDNAPVMRVDSERDVLLRGTIRSTYTGYSWIDDVPKNRYLYYDFTHTGVRDRVFNQNFDGNSSAFEEVAVSIEMLDDATSTLFVSARMSDLKMDLANAIYYNSAGEVFLTREVQVGDAYSLTALMPQNSEALRDTLLRAESTDDDDYANILSMHTALPSGIETDLYELAIQLTQGATNAYDKAMAIENYLRENCSYTLDTDYPPEARDFVSYFVLDSKEGYCSYFASAMAVMGRIAGLPTRYVEGYAAHANSDGAVTLTGEDAHAWVEVYFKGMGWISFDPSGGAGGNQTENSDDDHTDDHTGDGDTTEAPLTEPTPTPTPSPHPDNGENDSDNDFDNDPTPSPEPEEDDPPEPEDDPLTDDTTTPEPWPDENDASDEDNSNDKSSSAWIWIVLIILLIFALIALVVLWTRTRLKKANPIWLCSQTQNAQQASMIVYRSILTLLAHMGQGPMNGESPEAFVSRIAQQFDNPDYEAFVRAVSLSRYARQPLDKSNIDSGLRAYVVFRNGMRRIERAKFALTRIFRGVGDFEAIP